MLHIVNPCNDPYWNLALEEYFLKSAPSDDDLVILWRNSPTVVIGRNQNTIAEINQAFIAANHVDVVRRLSGGGAVYHDLGNLNFTFITAASAATRNNFATFTIPIINALGECGITAAFTGRNDLTIAGQKFSGSNAQYIHRDRLLHHGTLLFYRPHSLSASSVWLRYKIQYPGYTVGAQPGNNHPPASAACHNAWRI